MFIINLTVFHIPTSHGPLVIAVKLKDKWTFVLLVYRHIAQNVTLAEVLYYL
jgi:hypothetical protein